MHLHKYITRVHTMLVLCCQFYPCSEAILSYARTPCPMTGLPSVVCGWVPFARAYPYVCAYPVCSHLSRLPPPPFPYISPLAPLSRVSPFFHPLLRPFSLFLSVSLTVIATFIFKVSWARYETGMDLASLPGFSYLSYQERTTNRLGFQWMEMNVDYYLYFIIVVRSKERVTIYC